MVEFIKGPAIPEGSKNDWEKEAKQWRLPYWDFARFTAENGVDTKKLQLPALATLPMVAVKVYDANSATFTVKEKPNPLYKFQTDKVMGELEAPYPIKTKGEPYNDDNLPFDKCRATTKYGLQAGCDVTHWADGGQNWQKSNQALNEHAWYQNKGDWDSVPTLQDMTYRLLIQPGKSWGVFSSSRYYDGDEDPQNWMNIESIHNNVHVSDGHSLLFK